MRLCVHAHICMHMLNTGLSGPNRTRVLQALKTLTNNPSIAMVYVTHRKDEIEALNFSNVLQLTRHS